jgi:hypothetical protein
MPSILQDQDKHTSYGLYERTREDTSSDEDRTLIVGDIKQGDPNSKVSELGFLVGIMILVGGLIFMFTHLLANGPERKFQDDNER